MISPILAVIQAAPAHFDPTAATAKASQSIAKAGCLATQVAALGHSLIPGYPLIGFHTPSTVVLGGEWRLPRYFGGYSRKHEYHSGRAFPTDSLRFTKPETRAVRPS